MGVSDTNPVHWNDRLRQERIQRNWRQQDLADRLGTTVLTIKRWERGSQQPSAYFRVKLCALFGKSTEQLGLVMATDVQASSHERQEQRAEPSARALPALWNVPYLRNPFFTGRDALLEHLHTNLKQKRKLALTQSLAVSGLGGVGKTHIALEYAYRYASAYQAVFWITAETAETLFSGFFAIAEVLALPEREEHDPGRITRAVTQWFSRHQGWLLILDNVEALEMLKPFLPASEHGALLLTTRLQALGGIAQPLAVAPLHREEGVTFLLQRARVLSPSLPLSSVPSAIVHAAQAVVDLLGGLPLALDQAGAYIEETECSLMHYRRLYQEHAGVLLNRRGSGGDDHPGSVVATVSFSLRQVERQSPAAADLLRLCAFLSPDAIPQELFVHEADVGAETSVTFDALQWDEVLAVLRRFSLVTRHADVHLLSMHRLVQVVITSEMDQVSYQYWARQAIQMMSRAFPHAELYTTWSQCQRLLPHAMTCAALVEEGQVATEEAAQLLHHLGAYLTDSGYYTQAEGYLIRSHTIRVQILGSEHLAVAESLNHLAEVAYYKGQFHEAETLHRQALQIREQQLGAMHPHVATSLHNLAGVYWIQGRNKEAEPLYHQALQIREEFLGHDHLDTADTLQNLAYVFFEQERYQESEYMYERALRIFQHALGPQHGCLAILLNNFGRLYHAQGRYEEEKQLYQRAKMIGEQVLGIQHPYYAITLRNLAQLACVEGEWTQAEQWYQQALSIREQVFGPENPRTAQSLHDLATLYRERGRTDQTVVDLYQRALAIREKSLRPDNPDLAETLHQLALLRETQGHAQEAASLYQRALAIREQVFGPQHSCTQATRRAYNSALILFSRNFLQVPRSQGPP